MGHGRIVVVAGIAAVLAMVGAGARARAAGGYDLVVTGGRVVDPVSGLDDVRHVGIRDGRVAAVSREPLRGERTIDARDRVVLPGFVDLHSHAVSSKTGSRMQVHDGVTTQLELESGMLPVGAWYERLAREGRPANYGTSVAWTFARAAAVSGLQPFPSPRFFREAQRLDAWQHDVATPAQVATIRRLLDEGLRDGALGVGVNGGYAPGYAALEMHAVHEVAARYRGRALYHHLRHMGGGPGGSAIDSLLEVIALAQVTSTPVHICHVHSVALQNVREALALVRAARRGGLAITAEAYPYGVMSTVIGAPFLRDPGFPRKLGFGPTDVVYLATGERPATMERLRELQRADPGGVGIMHFFDLEEPDQRGKFDAVMGAPDVIVASDAMIWQRGSELLEDVWPLPAGAVAHPRSAGTYARFLREFVRERKLVSLVDAVRRTSLLPARLLEGAVPAMARKGRIAPGADADLLVIDLAAVGDRATFEQPGRTSVGFEWVLVGGVPVIADGVFDPSADAGRPIRARLGAGSPGGG